MDILRLVIFLIGKFCIASIFASLFAFTGETFPTVVRGIGSGVSLLLQYLGYIIASLKDNMSEKDPNVPLILFGVVTAIGGILTFLLPETLNQPLPQTIEDGENFGKNRSIKEFFHCCPLRPEVHEPKQAESVSTIPMDSTQNLVSYGATSQSHVYM